MKLKFVIVAQNKGDVLPRVVMLFHRLAIEIESIHMPARGKGSELRIAIVVNGKQAQTHRMEASLEKLVDALSVEAVCRGKRAGKCAQACS